MQSNLFDQQNWILLPPGGTAICRKPADHIPDTMRLATATELLAANLGRPFPWGSLPSPKHASLMWQTQRIGYGGLFHEKWFITQQGRFDGAANVPTSTPGSLRCSLLYDGGLSDQPDQLAENEGFALIQTVDEENLDLYRRVQMHAAEHVVADGGHIIVSPIKDGKAYVGFVGRCQTCPNPELISFRQLQKAVPNYEFELFDEWKNWSLTPKKAEKSELVA